MKQMLRHSAWAGLVISLSLASAFGAPATTSTSSADPKPAIQKLQDKNARDEDRLAAVKGLAQLGATLGREFSYELLQAVFPWDEATLRRAVYLSPAANSAGPVWGRSHAVNRTVMTSQTGLTRRTSGHFPCP